MPSPTHPPTDTGAIGAERSVLEGLLARVEAASGPDREIDAGLMSLTYKRGWRKLGVQESGPKGWREIRSNCWVDPTTKSWVTTAKQGFEFTASIDAALALQNRVLPGWNWSGGSDGYEIGMCWARVFPGNRQSDGSGNQYAKNPALALLAAMLRALIAQAPSPATTPTGVLETSLIVEGDSAVAESARTGPVARPETNALPAGKED